MEPESLLHLHNNPLRRHEISHMNPVHAITRYVFKHSSSYYYSLTSSSSYMALQPISGLDLLFVRLHNHTLIDGW
jgi:hypothetical protein